MEEEIIMSSLEVNIEYIEQQTIKNNVSSSLYYGTHVKATGLERLMNREFNGSFQLTL